MCISDKFVELFAVGYANITGLWQVSFLFQGIMQLSMTIMPCKETWQEWSPQTYIEEKSAVGAQGSRKQQLQKLKVKYVFSEES